MQAHAFRGTLKCVYNRTILHNYLPREFVNPHPLKIPILISRHCGKNSILG
jgi:hypothetical protein